MLDLPFAYSTNGKGTVEDDRDTGRETDMLYSFPTPDALWARYRSWKGIVEDVVAEGLLLPFNRSLRNPDGTLKEPGYYQRTAVNRSVEAILQGMALEVRLGDDARLTKDIDLGLRDNIPGADDLQERLVDALLAIPTTTALCSRQEHPRRFGRTAAGTQLGASRWPARSPGSRSVASNSTSPPERTSSAFLNTWALEGWYPNVLTWLSLNELSFDALSGERSRRRAARRRVRRAGARRPP